MQKINNISSKNPFNVPENYFDEVNKKILASSVESEREVRKIRPYNRFRNGLLIAASIAGFVVISYTALRLLAPHKTDSQISETLNGINTESIINDMDISTLEENVSSSMLSGEGPDVSRRDIIDYLLLNNIELNDIYEQL